MHRRMERRATVGTTSKTLPKTRLLKKKRTSAGEDPNLTKRLLDVKYLAKPAPAPVLPIHLLEIHSVAPYSLNSGFVIGRLARKQPMTTSFSHAPALLGSAYPARCQA